jgi:pyruvate kinase
MKARGGALLVAKIERVEAISALQDIVNASDAIMVARGDLAVEVGDAAVPALQKRMIRMSREHNKLVITATQMMESMMNHPSPTRAEVSDVANAVLDGTDAVMLSGETATGKYPVQTIRAMARVCEAAEIEDQPGADRMRAGLPQDVEEAIGRATMYTASSLKIKAVAAMTQSGKTVQLMSRMSSSVPIYALSSVTETRRRVTLFRGVYPIKFKGAADPEKALHMAEDELLKRGAVESGDFIVLTIGEPFGKAGGTNTMKIVKVGEHRKR